MNAAVSPYIAGEHRLALGVEPTDALRGTRVAAAIGMAAFRSPFLSPGSLQLEAAKVERHDTGLHVIRQRSDLPATVEIRIFDAPFARYSSDMDRRRFVPRHFRVPLLPIEQAEQNPPGHRIRRPAMFPGAAYDVPENLTGLRGRVTRGGQPLQWCRVEALAGGVLVGRAHGDDRGEFLLLVESRAAGPGDLVVPLTVEVRIFGRLVPSPNPGQEPIAADPLWDLPVEILPAPGAPDPVSSSQQMPAGYGQLGSRNVNLTLGLLRGGEPVFAV